MSGIAIAMSSTAYEKALTENGLEIVVARRQVRRDRGTADASMARRGAVPPEFKSKPLKPHPLFAGFVEASHRHARAAQTQRAATVVG